MASAGTPLLTVVDISRVVARANVPLEQAGFVRTGAQASIALADGSLPIPGKVTIVSPAADPGSTTLQVWVQADNPGGLHLTAGNKRSSPDTKSGAKSPLPLPRNFLMEAIPSGMKPVH